ncbi:hypothetical protein DCC81_02115 [Chitinophaga parva]|uniref:PAP2 family protein n=1 Tax=Chitinophaga parva TaxID=2169414 RepID=A0A2T7BKU3_9BACT|nr:hypothetical protein [Chitinophaga parva]PUZ28303.1 hypothetical protein DCC81_02115 [Chitinophaga parva]
MMENTRPAQGSRTVYTSAPSFPKATKAFAQVVSVIFHPLFIPTLITVMLVCSLPEYFATFRNLSKRFDYDIFYFRVVSITLMFPLLVVLLCRTLGFLPSIQLKGQQDRIIPYLSTMIFYFWAFYTFKKEGQAPPFFVVFFLGIFIAVIVSFITNIFVKISMHMVGWGGVIGYLLTLMWGLQVNVSLPLLVAFLVCGLVATCRMILNAHSPFEVYLGIVVGIVSQLVAYGIVG